MQNLEQQARELIAASAKATPGPWCHGANQEGAYGVSAEHTVTEGQYPDCNPATGYADIQHYTNCGTVTGAARKAAQ